MPTHSAPPVDRLPLRESCQALSAKLGRKAAPMTDKLREEADAIVAGRHWFSPSDRYIEVGTSGIDWTGGQHGHHAWNPCRFRFLDTLNAAWSASGDERYARAMRDTIADWCHQHAGTADYAMVPGENTLDIGARNVFWGRALDACIDCPAWDDAFLAEMVAAIALQLDWLQAHLSPKNNFRLHQAQALLENGVRLSQLAASASWRQVAVRTFNEAARRQILADGAHAECTPSYHSGMARLFANCLRLAPLLTDASFSFDAQTLLPMFDYWLAATKPNGSLCGINDSEGIYEGSQRNDAMAARQAFCETHGLAPELPGPSLSFPAARQAYLRDSWETDASYLTFDSSTWGGAHTHLSRNAVQLHAFGRSFLVDPGRIEYEMSNPLGPYGKSTRAHCTANLNGWNQNTTDCADFRAWHAPGFDLVRSLYNGGYWPAPFSWWFSQGMGHGLGATHDRTLFWVHGRWAVVIDELMRWDEARCDASHQTPRLEINWQFAPGKVTVDHERRQARTTWPDANLHMHFPLLPDGAELRLHEGEMEPPLGWVRRPGAGLGGIPAPLLSVVAEPMHRFDDGAVTVLIPQLGSAPPPLAAMQATRGSLPDGQPGSLELQWQDGSRESLLWMPELIVMLGRQDDVETDGSLLYRHYAPDGTLTAAAAADATWCDSPLPPTILHDAPPGG